MNLRTTLALAVLGMGLSTAGAMAIPNRPQPSEHWVDPNDHGPAVAGDGSHFVAGQTLTIDGRLGHTTLARGADGETYLFASVTGADAPSLTAPPLNLAIVIDRSGSMKGERIANAMDAAVGIVERMRDADSVTVVSFDTESQIVVAPTLATASAKPSIAAAIRSIRLGGDTCISCGLETAARELALSTGGGGSDRINRMILLSDGEANHGIRDVPGFRAMASRMRDRGCSVTTIGVDVEFDEKVMAAIAQESNGRHYFVANATDLPNIFEQEFDSLLASVARDSEMSVEPAPGVDIVQVFDRSFRRDGSRVVVPFGTFSAKQEKTVLMKVRVPVDREGVTPVAEVKVSYRDLLGRTDASSVGDLALRVSSDGSAQRELDPFVAERLARSQTAETLTEANKLFVQGRTREAQGLLAKRETELKDSAISARHAARSQPVFAPAKKAADEFEGAFDKQLSAVATAQSNFAPPPPRALATATANPFGGSGGSSGFAAQAAASSAPAATPPAETRRGKAQVRSNQESALDLAK